MENKNDLGYAYIKRGLRNLENELSEPLAFKLCKEKYKIVKSNGYDLFLLYLPFLEGHDVGHDGRNEPGNCWWFHKNDIELVSEKSSYSLEDLSTYVEFSDEMLSLKYPSLVNGHLYGYVVKEQNDDSLIVYVPLFNGTNLGHNNDTGDLEDVCKDNCWVVHKDDVHYTSSLFEETGMDEFEDEEKEDDPFVREVTFYSDDVNTFSEEAPWIDFHTGETQEVSNEYTEIEQENKELKEAYEKLENEVSQLYVENARLNKELSQYENLVKKLNYYIKGFGVA